MAKKASSTERGQVKVSVVKGLLNLQIPSIYANKYYGRKQHYISFGARDTRENMLLAMQGSLELQRDLENDVFDIGSIDKYRHPSKRIERQYRVDNPRTEEVLELYDEFVASSGVSQSTLIGSYKGFKNHIARMINDHNYTIRQQLEIKTWLESKIAPTQALAMLSVFHRMIEWGKREDRLPSTFVSKFKEYETAYKKKLRTVNTSRKPPKGTEHLISTEGIGAWSEQERDVIIAAFHARLGAKEQAKQNRAGQLDYKAHLIEFLFLVGCRHGEAFALTWGDVSEDFKKIRINKSYSSSCCSLKGTKTGKVRTIPINNRVQDILRFLKPVDLTAETLVFPNKFGKYLTSDRICDIWNPSGQVTVIGRLIEEQKLTRYLDAYSTRRTFVSLQISKGASVVDVAQWVGDNPETILKHYARHNDEKVPF